MDLQIFFIIIVFSTTLAQSDEALKAFIDDVYNQPSTTEDLSPFLQDIFRKISPTKDENKNAESSSCTCVPNYLCDDDGFINTNGVGIVNLRSIDTCDGPNEICCTRKKMESTTPTVTKPTTKPTASSASLPETPTPQNEKCGYLAPSLFIRISGDSIENQANFGEFPWMVAIFAGGEEMECGGSLIHPKAVVTAAHCVSDRNKQFKVRVGEWDTQTTRERFSHEDAEVESVIVHPRYYKTTLINDIAVLFLKTSVKLRKYVNVICLPPQGSVVDSDTRCIVSGWGKDRYDSNRKHQSILKRIELPIVNKKDCEENLKQKIGTKFFHLHKSFICAGGEPEEDSCNGDGGSPLVCPIPENEDDRYYQAGIVSWGLGCGERNIPGVYVNLALFRDWIDEQMNKQNLNISAYQY